MRKENVLRNLSELARRQTEYGMRAGVTEAIKVVQAMEDQKQGKWVKAPGFASPGGDPVWRCSECGKGLHTYGIKASSYAKDVADRQWVSCPNCGSLMDGEQDA